MLDTVVRPMTFDDAAAVAGLANQLGYEISAGTVGDWVAGASESRVALVAEIEGGVVGWIEAHDRELLQHPRVVEIGGLVVEQGMRGRGIGESLVAAIRTWGLGRGHTEIMVRSNITRDGAHQFYEGLGFRRAKTSHTFSLEIE
jgi:GNAT superfamily N-acetyltransferase